MTQLCRVWFAELLDPDSRWIHLKLLKPEWRKAFQMRRLRKGIKCRVIDETWDHPWFYVSNLIEAFDWFHIVKPAVLTILHFLSTGIHHKVECGQAHSGSASCYRFLWLHWLWQGKGNTCTIHHQSLFLFE